MNFPNTEADRLDLLKRAVHAVRSPVSGIWDLADTILATKQEFLDEQTCADIAQIQELAHQELVVADAMAMLMRVDIVQPTLVPVNIADVVAEAIRRYDTSPYSNRQTVHVSLPPELPFVDAAPDLIAHATFLLLTHCSRDIAQDAEINLAISTSDSLVKVTINAERTTYVSPRGIADLELLTVDRILTQHQGKFWIEKCVDQVTGYSYSLPVVKP